MQAHDGRKHERRATSRIGERVTRESPFQVVVEIRSSLCFVTFLLAEPSSLWTQAGSGIINRERGGGVRDGSGLDRSTR